VDLPDRTGGAALFADISGFTPLTEALARMLGPRQGADALTRQLNRVYDALIDAVDAAGGSVIGFSGDAMTCWFDEQGIGDRGWEMEEERPTPHPQLPSPVGRAVASARAVHPAKRPRAAGTLPPWRCSGQCARWRLFICRTAPASR
jgi:class 3 adenylate cyclase